MSYIIQLYEMSRIDKYTGDGKQISGYEGPGEGDREE
jgi:hypothetical protein